MCMIQPLFAAHPLLGRLHCFGGLRGGRGGQRIRQSVKVEDVAADSVQLPAQPGVRCRGVVERILPEFRILSGASFLLPTMIVNIVRGIGEGVNLLLPYHLKEAKFGFS